MLRGDSHRFYAKLRRTYPAPPPGPVHELDHIRAIRDYYAGFDLPERQLLLAWAKKEESGIGLIPAALSGVPLIGLIFAPFAQQTVRQLVPSAWAILWFVGALGFIAGIYIHQRQKAWSTLHVHILETLCKEPPAKARHPEFEFTNELTHSAGESVGDHGPAH